MKIKFWILLVWFLGILWSSQIIAGNLDASFNGTYPKNFFQTTTGMITGITVAAAIATVIVSLTVPAAGGAILAFAKGYYTAIGTAVGKFAGYGSGAAAAGLAILGGGTIASGGFGMAGGVTVITFVTELGTGIVMEIASDAANRNSDKEAICKDLAFPAKLSLPAIGREQVSYLIEELKKLEASGGASSKSDKYNQYLYTRNQIRNELNALKRSSDSKDLQSILVRSVYNFNNSEPYNVIKEDISYLREHASKTGFLDFLEGLLEIKHNNYNKGIELITSASDKEPQQLKPYYWLIYYYRNKRDFDKALMITDKGIDSLSRNRFPLYWEAAKLHYRKNNYSKSAELFAKSFDDISDDSVKVEAAHMVAVSYLKLRDYPTANKWHDESIKILNKQKEEARKINNQENANELAKLIDSNKVTMMELWGKAQSGQDGAIVEISLNERNDGSFSARCK